MKWRILDQAVVTLLRKNGFRCERPETRIPGAAISFEIRTKEENQWYESDVPMERNQTYTLPNGSTLKAEGTLLIALV